MSMQSWGRGILLSQLTHDCWESSKTRKSEVAACADSKAALKTLQAQPAREGAGAGAVINGD